MPASEALLEAALEAVLEAASEDPPATVLFAAFSLEEPLSALFFLSSSDELPLPGTSLLLPPLPPFALSFDNPAESEPPSLILPLVTSR